MRVNDIITENKSALQKIVDDAEAEAFEQSSESKSSVSGDTVLKFAMERINKLGMDKSQKAIAIKMVSDIIAREHGK